MHCLYKKAAATVLALAATVSLATGCGAAAGAPAASAPSPAFPEVQAQSAGALEAWKDQVVYFVLLDRFANGNTGNDFNVKRDNMTAYHGGDLDGLIARLPYIAGLGATTLWISPLYDNDDRQLKDLGMWGYHGYWPKDFEKVDEHLGDEAKVRELLAKAHGLGMKVLLDVVANHGGYDYKDRYDPKFKGWFHWHGDVRNWDDQWWVENGDIAGLPDFDQSNPDARRFLIEMGVRWARMGFDGLRVDTVKHVPKDFWAEYNRAVKQAMGPQFLLLGEVMQGDPGYVADYQRAAGFDSLFDFPLHYTLTDVFARGQSMRKLGERLAQDSSYPRADLMSPFLDNHDVPRFLSVAGNDHNRLRLALACLLTWRGIPALYYGTEVGLKGGQDPANREDMPWGQHPELTKYVKTLLGIRKASGALRRGQLLEMWQDDLVYGFSRLTGQEEAIVVLNNADQPQEREIPLRAESRLANGTQLTDALSGETVRVENRKLRVTLKAKQARIYLAR